MPIPTIGTIADHPNKIKFSHDIELKVLLYQIQ